MWGLGIPLRCLHCGKFMPTDEITELKGDPEDPYHVVTTRLGVLNGPE